MRQLFTLWIALILLAGCKAYKQDILFQLDEEFTANNLTLPVAQAEANYRLQPDDLFRMEVFTNKGERLVDPNFELVQQGMNNQAAQVKDRYQFLIQADGSVKLPIIGKVQVNSLTVDEAEAVLENYYNEFYVESFVKLTLLNRRVVVLGANGGQVIPIPNENTTLPEVLALYGGLNLGAKAANISVIRGDLTKPEVYKVDLSTLSAMQRTMVQIETGDIIYVEPWRRPWIESLRDVSPVLSMASSVLTLIVVVQNLGN